MGGYSGTDYPKGSIDIERSWSENSSGHHEEADVAKLVPDGEGQIELVEEHSEGRALGPKSTTSVRRSLSVRQLLDLIRSNVKPR